MYLRGDTDLRRLRFACDDGGVGRVWVGVYGNRAVIVRRILIPAGNVPSSVRMVSMAVVESPTATLPFSSAIGPSMSSGSIARTAAGVSTVINSAASNTRIILLCFFVLFICNTPLIG